GFAVSIGEEEIPKTWVSILGEKLSFCLEEGLNCEEKIESFFSHRHQHTYVPNGKLTLRVEDTLGHNYHRQWSDGKAPLENRLNTVITGKITAAEATRTVREENERRDRERKEEERRREEHERRRRREAARIQDFEQKQASWEAAQRIRAFVTAVQEHAISRD